MVSEKHRRLRNRHKRRRKRAKVVEAPKPKQASKRKGIDKLFHDHYKPLFFITIALLLFSVITIGITYANTGDIFYKGVSLSGGLTVTVPTSGSPIDVIGLEEELFLTFPDADFEVREISDLGKQSAVIIEAAPATTDQDALMAFEDELLTYLEASVPDVRSIASREIIGSSLGKSFFTQIVKAVLIAFALMAMVVFIYFGETLKQKLGVIGLTIVEAILIWNSANIVAAILAVLLGIVLLIAYIRFSIPSFAVILAAVSTILFTIAIVDILHMRISTAGIAAFLMLIGYSVDTDILLSTRVLKRTEGSVYDRVVGTIKTGLTMEVSTMCAALMALIFTKSDVIKEIMFIVLIGLIADVFFTWIQNAGLLRLYLEKKEGRNE